VILLISLYFTALGMFQDLQEAAASTGKSNQFCGTWQISSALLLPYPCAGHSNLPEPLDWAAEEGTIDCRLQGPMRPVEHKGTCSAVLCHSLLYCFQHSHTNTYQRPCSLTKVSGICGQSTNGAITSSPIPD
jgi:hypothetical protein